jgi:hypothetical protein
VACNKSEKFVTELTAFQEELQANSANYTIRQWENAEAMLAAFKADAIQLKASNVEKQKINQIIQSCEDFMALHVVCELKEFTKKLKAGYLDFSNEQWQAVKATYSTLLSNIDPQKYNEEQIEEINLLVETCTLVFSMQPILELQELCRYISENDSVIDYNHRNQLKVKYLNVCMQLQEYEYSTELHWKIDKLQELFDSYWEHTRWNSVKNTVNSHIQELFKLIEEKK